MKPSVQHKYSAQEITGVLLDIIEENRTGDKKADEIIADYVILGVVNQAFERLRRRRRNFTMVEAREIKERRIALGLNRDKVARYIGVKAHTYGRYERGDYAFLKFESMWHLFRLIFEYEGNPPDKRYFSETRKTKARTHG